MPGFGNQGPTSGARSAFQLAVGLFIPARKCPPGFVPLLNLRYLKVILQPDRSLVRVRLQAG